MERRCVMSDYEPPTKAQFNAAIERIERGLATLDDAHLIRDYVQMLMEERDYLLHELRRERERNARFMRALDDAFNSGSGAYIP
jgi:hypothetical protein